MRNLIGLILGLTIICVLSCGNDKTDLIWVFITETQCANEWDGLGLGSTEANVTQYLKNNDIEIYDINIEQYAIGPTCLACTCASGRNIQVCIEAKDLESAEDLGFTVE